MKSRTASAHGRGSDRSSGKRSEQELAHFFPMIVGNYKNWSKLQGGRTGQAGNEACYLIRTQRLSGSRHRAEEADLK